MWGTLTSTKWVMLERIQFYICKSMQGLPRRIRSDICLSLINWFSLESYVDEKKLIFGRICNLPSYAISFRILIHRISDLKYNKNNHPNLGFTSDIVQILKKYNLLEYLVNFYDTGLFPSPTMWKRIVKTDVQSNEAKMWTLRIISDDDLLVLLKLSTRHMNLMLHGLSP